MGQADVGASGHVHQAGAGHDTTVAPTSVSLTIGAVHREVRLARLVAAGVAAMAAFDLESTEDLRIAVDEACVWLIEQGDHSPLALTFSTGEPGRVEVRGETASGDETSDPQLTGLVAQIIAASCEQHRFDVADGMARFSLTAAAIDIADASDDAAGGRAPEPA